MSEVGSKAISFKLYREGEDLESLEIPEAMTVRQLATIHERYEQAGYKVLYNGRPATKEELRDIAATVSKRGVAVRFGTERASMDSLIPQNSVVTMAGEQKGGLRIAA